MEANGFMALTQILGSSSTSLSWNCSQYICSWKSSAIWCPIAMFYSSVTTKQWRISSTNIIRPLVMEAIQHNIMLLAKHISGKSNILPDRISRFQVTDGLLRQYNMEVTPTDIPQDLLPEKLHNKIIQDLESAFSISANSQYKRNWNNFADFMHHLGKSPLPTSSYNVALYVTHVRHNEKIKSTTLRSRLSAIAHYHKINSRNDPTKDFIISKLVKSHAKKDNLSPTRKGISFKLLTKLVTILSSVSTGHCDFLLFRVISTFMYYAALRSSEIWEFQPPATPEQSQVILHCRRPACQAIFTVL